MTDTTSILVADLVSNLLFGLIVLLAVGIFFERRRTSLPVTVLSYLCAYVLTSSALFWASMIAPFGSLLANFFVSMAALFIISLNYESSMVKRLAAISCMNFLFVAVNQALATLPFSRLANLVGPFVFPQVMKVPILLIVLLFRWRFKSIRTYSADSRLFWIPMLIIVLALNATLVLTAAKLDQVASFLSAVIVFAASFIAFYLFDTLTKEYEHRLAAATTAQETVYLQAQCQLMQESVTRMKSLRHDTSHHLVALRALTQDNQDAQQYLDTLLSSMYDGQDLLDTGNVAVDSVVNFKLRDAQDAGVKLRTHALVPPVLNVDTVDLVVILGNLLDNAVAAVAGADDKWIDVSIAYDKDCLLIRVDNTYDGGIGWHDTKPDLGDLSPSQRPVEEHGFGLNNVERSIEKYNGQMEITHTAGVFSVTALLYTTTR